MSPDKKEEILHAVPKGAIEEATKLVNEQFSSHGIFAENIRKWKELFDLKKFRQMFEENEISIQLGNDKTQLPMSRIRDLFFNAEFVLSFLTRESKEVEFDETNSPKLEKHENKIYRYAAKELDTSIPYRASKDIMFSRFSEDNRPHFFKSPTSGNAMKVFDENFKKSLDSLSGECDIWAASAPASRIQIRDYKDNIKDNLTHICNHPESEFSFLILPARESGHAMLWIAIMNNKSNACDGIIFMNSMHSGNARYSLN